MTREVKGRGDAYLLQTLKKNLPAAALTVGYKRWHLGPTLDLPLVISPVKIIFWVSFYFSSPTSSLGLCME